MLKRYTIQHTPYGVSKMVAMSGNLRALKWAIKIGCPMNENVFGIIPETDKNTLKHNGKHNGNNGRQFDVNILNMTEIQYKDTIVLLIPLGKVLEVFELVGNPSHGIVPRFICWP
jgi:hypothetical protein